MTRRETMGDYLAFAWMVFVSACLMLPIGAAILGTAVRMFRWAANW